MKDIDFGHNHNGAGDPHAHDWKYPSDKAPNKIRGEARSLTRFEKIDLKYGKCLSAILGGAPRVIKSPAAMGASLLLYSTPISQCQDTMYARDNPEECNSYSMGYKEP